MKKEKSLTVIATMPPPVTGMTLATVSLVKILRNKCNLTLVEVNSKKFNKGFLWKLAKGFIVLKIAFNITSGRCQIDKNVYLVANSGLGLIYNLFLIILLRKKRIFIHHHAYSYINEKSILMVMILFLTNKNGFHVFLDQLMRDELNKTYNQDVRGLVLSNTMLMDDSMVNGSIKDFSKKLGFLSNISFEKGIVEVCDTFANLLNDGHDVELFIAGPCTSGEVKKYLQMQQDRFGKRFSLLGPVFGKDKEKFYDFINLFLFPTKYINEAQPIVVLEALRAGVPVVANKRGCIESFHDGAGCSVVDADQFTQTVSRLLTTWENNHQQYSASSLAARECWNNNRNFSRQQLEHLVESLL